MSEYANAGRTKSQAADEAAAEAARERLVIEVRTALDADPDVRAWPPNWEQRGRVDYFYRSGSLLTRDADLSRVQSVLSDLGAQPESGANKAVATKPAQPGGNPLISGITQLSARVRESQRTPDLVEDLDERLGVGVATHDHGFVVTYNIMCPATEPEPVITPQQATDPVVVDEVLWPQAGDPGAGRDVRVAVVDTGLLRDVTWSWVQDVRPDTVEDYDDPDQFVAASRTRAQDGFADPYAGHGTFISGVIRSLAPACDIVVERVLGVSGFVTESNLITQIHDALSRSPDLINMSAGGFTRRNIPSLAFQTLWEERLSRLGGVVLVAAAGNDGSSDPFWPAAFPWCVGVGSMTRDGQRRSWFSNYGSWVDVYAPGQDIVNAYARLKYKTVSGEVRDTSAGLVKWSGTSFATPIVSGLIAARMSRTGENARQAADALLVGAQYQFRPGVGPRLFP